MKFIHVLFILLITNLYSQSKDLNSTITSINLEILEEKKIHKFWLDLGTDAFNNKIKVPVLIAKGVGDKPVLGLTAAIHGNEINGIPIIHKIFEEVNVEKLKGTIIAIPGINPLSVFNNQRRFIDNVDLNRIFPGKENGNRSQQMVYQINEKIIKLFDFHIDMHTASFGRINSMYARADISSDTLATMAKLQKPDLILSNKGKPSFGDSKSLTLRASALQQGTHSITVEYGNPQVYQPKLIKRGTKGILNLLSWLKMITGTASVSEDTVVCSKSYWIYTNQGGLLEVPVVLNEKIKKGQVIGVLKDPFGKVIEEYLAPENGIVIGKSTNPINTSGGRIIHLGIIKN